MLLMIPVSTLERAADAADDPGVDADVVPLQHQPRLLSLSRGGVPHRAEVAAQRGTDRDHARVHHPVLQIHQQTRRSAVKLEQLLAVLALDVQQPRTHLAMRHRQPAAEAQELIEAEERDTQAGNRRFTQVRGRFGVRRLCRQAHAFGIAPGGAPQPLEQPRVSRPGGLRAPLQLRQHRAKRIQRLQQQGDQVAARIDAAAAKRVQHVLRGVRERLDLVDAQRGGVALDGVGGAKRGL
jgi:hypothetical protein